MFKLNQIKVNYMVEPVTITGSPVFSWTYEPNCSEKQVSSQIKVTTDKGVILWDSPIINNDLMTSIKYKGKALPSMSVIYVEVTTKSDTGNISKLTTKFETTLNENEWKGRWISLPNSFNGGTLYFRKRIKLEDKEIKKARAYICGIGYHEFYINGAKVSDRVLNPGVTDYDKTLLYDTYDMTSLLCSGDNIVGIEVGYGWFGSRKLLAQFYVEYADGEVYEDHSDCNFGWWVSGTPILENSIYGGEIYDARIEDKCIPHWASLDFEPTWANGWMFTILTQTPKGKLTPQEIPPIKLHESYKVKNEVVINDKITIYDFGQNLAGWVRFTCKGTRGSKIILIFGEGIDDNGRVNQLNLRSARCSDTYILKGSECETYAPRFTYHGFQYCEVHIEGEAKIIDIVAQHVHSDVKIVGKFECDDQILNKLHNMAVVTEQNNQYSILTDCPQRDERFGWLNDLSSRVFQSNYNFDMDRFYNKVVHDISETMRNDGAIADTAPYYTGGQPADTTVASYLLLALSAYKLYGDKDLLYREYDGHKKWIEYLLTRQKDYIMDYYYYADWVSPQTLKNSNSDGIFISSLFLHWHLKLIAEIAKILNKRSDYKKYSQMVNESRKSLNSRYYHADKKYYCNNTQCENAMAVWLDVCLEENKNDVVKNIVKDIIDNNNHLTCGNQGYRHVFYLLCEYGYSDLAIKVLKNPEYPGWGYMVEKGATTIWERWESKMENIMHSFDHPMFGSFDAIFYRYFAGIKIDGNGASDITIEPIVPNSLNYVKAEYNSIKGLIKSSWVKKENSIEYVIEVPTNTSIRVIMNKKVVSIDTKNSKKQKIVLGGGTHHIVTKL